MLTKKFFSVLAAFVFVAATLANAAEAFAATPRTADERARSRVSRVRVPLNLAILVQDDLVSRVGNELELTREYVRALPAGSRVMVGYIRAGSLQVRQGFTTDLEQAARSLRVPVGSTAASPFNPYTEVRDALKRFEPADGENRNALLLISDGLDVSRGFDSFSSINSIDLERAIREARRRNVAVYTFYAPSVGLTSFSNRAVSYGQGALSRFANETGGHAFFQGTDFVSFSPYFERLSRTLNKEAGAGL